MGTRAFLQKGRGKPGIVLPANAVARVNQASDRSALVRAADKAMEEHSADPLPNIGMSIAAKLKDDVVGPVELGTGATLATMQPAPIEPDPTPDGPNLKCDAPAPEPAPQAEEQPAEQVSSFPLKAADPPSLPLKVTADPNAPLTVVAGIGTALAERFATYGYRTLAELAQADPDSLNEVQGVRTRGRQWVDDARKRLGLP